MQSRQNQRHLPPSYYKIHGSIGWNYQNESSKIPLIMGTGKAHTIDQEPLLKEYLQKFKEDLALSNSSLLVIGYSFGDTHINKIIVDALSKGLNLHIIDPKPVNEFKNNVDTPEKIAIFNRMNGYYDTTLSSLFPYREETVSSEGIGSTTYAWQQLRENFFQN